jgi:cleavage and polyadenylation specificity factor subunit 3
MLYDETDLRNSLQKIGCVDFHQEMEVNGIKFSCYMAGHVLGASMTLLDIDGIKILYTGDYSREEDRHLRAAEFPTADVDILIVESTYGIKIHEPRMEREKNFTELVHKILKRGGKILLPVFALGRAQEILLILNEYWAANPDIKDVPIFYAGSLAQKSLTVF